MCAARVCRACVCESEEETLATKSYSHGPARPDRPDRPSRPSRPDRPNRAGVKASLFTKRETKRPGLGGVLGRAFGPVAKLTLRLPRARSLPFVEFSRRFCRRVYAWKHNVTDLASGDHRGYIIIIGDPFPLLLLLPS